MSKQVDTLQIEKGNIEDELSRTQEKRNKVEAEVKKEKANMTRVTNELEEVKAELRQTKKKLEELNSTKKAIRGGKTSSLDEYQTFEATGYCPCSKCCGKWAGGPTASGVMPKANRTIAVDSSVIPLGSKVEIEGMGTYTAEDTGSAVKGKIIDIYHNKHSDAWAFGRQEIKLRILN